MYPDNRPSLEDERKRYELHRNDPCDTGYRNHLLKVLDPLRDYISAGVVLDFGCGQSLVTSEILQHRGFTTFRYDPLFVPNEAALYQTYDCVVCIEVAEHFVDPKREFSLLYRLLKPGGWLAISTKLLLPEQTIETWWYAKDPTHVSLYRRETINWIEGAWGWTVFSSSEDVHLFRKRYCGPSQ
jgi:2-polyprenyl-3-methyl-5-hydroxy-6-metoxy-1,4-benzoquinol methylase